MKKVLIFGALLAMAFGFAGVAKADTTSAGGVSYTFTNTTDASDPSGTFDITMVIDTTGATASGTLNSFSVQFTGASNVILESTPSGTGTWVNEGKGPNTASGCNINGSANHWCIDSGSISVTSGGPGGTFTFVFDVVGLTTAPTTTHIQAFQGQGALAISNDVGIGPGVPTPEPASILLLGLGLAGAPFLRRRK